MCFSASASFGAGVVLSVIGVATLKKVNHRSQLAFASIPLIFAVQQFTEGFLWLSLTHAEYASLSKITTYLFLFIAQIIWPFWVPFSILILDKKERRNTFGKTMLIIGTTVSIYLAYCLLKFPVEGKVIGYHIAYLQEYPESLSLFGGIFYVIATIAPPFFSPYKRMWTMGIAILISYIISTLFYNEYIVSVWCFFASIISISIYGVMLQIKTERKLKISTS